MIPLFKSNYSIGRSILTFDAPLPADKVDEEAADSILQIATEAGLKQVVVVEDTMIGFLEMHKASKKLGIQLIFGLRIDCCNDVIDEQKAQSKHKVIIFSKNDDGCKLLNKIYSEAFCEHEGYVDCTILAKYWNDESLKLAVPFYDSFIHNNNFSFLTCLPNFNFTKPEFFIERNGLPFDSLLEQKVLALSESPVLTKSIFYKNKKDVFAFQTYKCITNRNFSVKAINLGNPNLNHFGSDEFCWESYLEVNV